MELFYTDIKLKDDITQNDVQGVIFEWLIGSPHYGIDTINYCGESFFHQDYPSSSVSILSICQEEQPIFAVRFINKEEKNIWTTDCIYLENEKHISISLSCHAKDYNRILPKIHKPYIIKKILEKNICNQSNIFPICDYPIMLTDDNLNVCARIINGETTTDLPVTYVSYNSYNPAAYSVDTNNLAIKLSGISHVLVEPNKEFALKLKELTNGNNPYNGYIGIYFPHSTRSEIISFMQFMENGKLDCGRMANAIRKNLQQALVNHNSSMSLCWDTLQVAYNKELLTSARKESNDAKNDLDEFIQSFDNEIKTKDEKIRNLRQQLENNDSIISGLQKKYDSQNVISFDKSNITEFYPGELNDLILTILSQAKGKIDANSRSYELIHQILTANEINGTGKKIFEGLKKAISEKSLSTRRKALENLGFCVTVGGHDKMYFHDPKYSLTLSNSPGDYRANENSIKDILKMINIYKKIL